MPTSVAGWVATPSAWDTMTLGGMTVPGLVAVTGKLARKDDTAEVPGVDGATQTVLGYAPAEFSVTITLWTDEQLAQYQALLRRFRPQRAEGKSAAARAVEVRHPAVQVCGLSQLTVYEMTAPEHTGKSIFRATMQLREFISEVKRSKASAGAKSVTGPPSWAGSISAQMTGGPSTGSVGSLTGANPDTSSDEELYARVLVRR